jgi:hypothetical protein
MTVVHEGRCNPNLDQSYVNQDLKNKVLLNELCRFLVKITLAKDSKQESTY